MDKQAWRRRVRASRRARSPERRSADGHALAGVVLARPELVSAHRVACYCSSSVEPGTAPLLTGLRARGVEVLLPVVTGGQLDWAVDDGGRCAGPYGLAEPTAARLGLAALATCDVALVPALAVDTAGRRLGQGGGYYDRALGAHRPAGIVVALVHDDELTDAEEQPVPADARDVRVDAVATPTRWVLTHLR